MIDALMLTMWFTDYWIDYAPIARANIDKAVRLAAELGDERLSIETQSAALMRATGTDVAVSADRLRQRLEALHDPVRLKELYYALMWQYLSRGSSTAASRRAIWASTWHASLAPRPCSTAPSRPWR